MSAQAGDTVVRSLHGFKVGFLDPLGCKNGVFFCPKAIPLGHQNFKFFYFEGFSYFKLSQVKLVNCKKKNATPSDTDICFLDDSKVRVDEHQKCQNQIKILYFSRPKKNFFFFSSKMKKNF